MLLLTSSAPPNFPLPWAITSFPLMYLRCGQITPWMLHHVEAMAVSRAEKERDTMPGVGGFNRTLQSSKIIVLSTSSAAMIRYSSTRNLSLPDTAVASILSLWVFTVTCIQPSSRDWPCKSLSLKGSRSAKELFRAHEYRTRC